MSVKEILLIGNKTLREISRDVDFNNDNINEYISDLQDTLFSFQKKKKIGRAIAGIQIGLKKRIIYMEFGTDKIIMINPLIVNKSGETFEVWDSCFSADVAFFGKTIRNKYIDVEYYDENELKIKRRFENDSSELFLHEIDHLDGILFTDNIINNQIIMRDEFEKL